MLGLGLPRKVLVQVRGKISSNPRLSLGKPQRDRIFCDHSLSTITLILKAPNNINTQKMIKLLKFTGMLNQVVRRDMSSSP